MVTREVVRLACIRLAIAVASYAGTIGAARPHPLHTTFTEVSLSVSGGVEIRLRTFIDDFSAAVAGHREAPRAPVGTPSEAATARYLAERVQLIDASGRRRRLVVTDLRREGDVVWVTLRAPDVRSLAATRLTNSVLFERYDDQVNVVQTSAGGRRRTVLFTTRDGGTPKEISSS